MNDDYEFETAALTSMLDGYTDGVLYYLKQLSTHQLNQLTDALDQLASLVDAEAIARAENRNLRGSHE